MKANETIVQSPIILMERRRKEECWRIGEAYYRPFIEHLQHYFKAKVCLSFCSVCYIDICTRDFCLVSYLFAAIWVSSDRITVRGIFPEEYLPLWEDHITLRLCLKDNDRKHFVPLWLELKDGNGK